MAVPVTGAVTAEQIAQQKTQDQSSQQLKQGQSKFDQTMADKAGQTASPQGVQGASEVQRANAVQQVELVNKLDKAQLNKIQTGQPNTSLTARGMDPVTAKPEASRAVSVMTHMVAEIEKGQGLLDKLINGGLHGAKFNNSELLALQAGMYKYTQELDLTGKVVEKATSGLKDTLKTQV